jgi:hypothetical protein
MAEMRPPIIPEQPAVLNGILINLVRSVVLAERDSASKEEGGQAGQGRGEYANIPACGRADAPKVSMGTSNWAPPAPAQRTNPLAIAALVCGIIEICCLFPIAIIAVILGHKARGQIRQTGERGRGMATTGLILGYIGLVVIVGVLFAVVLLAVR